jgi:GNAT superfamily N-acetyltransferase
LDNPPLPAMAAALTSNMILPKNPENICVWKARTIKDLQAASLIRRTAFKFREGEALTYFEDMASDWLENETVTLWLAGASETEPVSIGAMIEAEGIPGVYVMATLPDHHRKGYGKAILTRIMSDAVSQGHKLLVLTASKAGYGLYSQFGFQHIFGFDFYELPA